MKAAIYCRVSTEEQAKEGFSIAAQKKTLLTFSQSKDWEVAKIYLDEGISGKSTRRPAFQEMMKDAAAGLFEVILVWKINRFSRKNSDLLNTVEYLSNHNVNLISYSEHFDASTPSGKLMLSMLGSIGEFERDTIVENIRAGMAERAGQGLFNGGCVLGYDTAYGKLIINEKEASTVKRIFELYMLGRSYSAIQKILKEENRTTKNNCSFQINSIKRILKNPIYAGYVTYNKTRKANNRVLKNQDFILVKGSHAHIIPKEDFDTVQQIIKSKKHLHNRQNDYILSGVLRCPVCRGRMTGHNGGRKRDGYYYRYYICLNYKKRGASVCSPNCINADGIENDVIEKLCTLISNPQIAKDVYGDILKISKSSNYSLYSELGMLRKDLAGRKKLLDKYISLFDKDSINSQLFESRLTDINTEIKQIKARMADVEVKISQSGCSISYDKILAILNKFKSHFLQLDNSAKKRIISSVIKEILLNSDKGIKSIVLNFYTLPQYDARYTDHNVKIDIHSRDC